MPGQWGFCGGSYQGISPVIDNERSVNLFPEKSESAEAKSPMPLLKRPGKKLFRQIPEPRVPSQLTVNGRSFAAASHLYELTGAGVVDWGSLGTTPLLPSQIAANEGQLLVKNNGNLFVFTLGTNVLAPVDMGQFNGPVSQIDSIDGYFVATIVDSHTFQQSQLEDGTTWNGLDIATISLFPDNIVSMKVSNRQIWFFSAKKTVPYYNAGAGFPVFIPVPDVLLEFGAGAAYATSQLDNNLLWLDQTERGSMVARRTAGYQSQRISTHAVEGFWQRYPNASDAVSFTYQENGHDFWQILFVTANATWVYDVSSGMWHERTFLDTVSGQESADRAMSHTFNFGKHLVGDWRSGNIYELSSEFQTDDGGPIAITRISPTFSQNGRYVYLREVIFDMQVGSGPQPPLLDGDGQPRAPQLLLSWSYDNGNTWSDEYILDIGQAGDFSARVRKQWMGRGRYPVLKVRGTDPVPYYFADAYLDVSVGVA